MPRKGEAFVMTQGDYSDYTIMGHFVATQDFLMSEAYAEYRALDLGEEPYECHYEYPRGGVAIKHDPPIIKMRKVYHTCDGFQAFLLRKELVTNLDCREFSYDYDMTKEGL